MSSRAQAADILDQHNSHAVAINAVKQLAKAGPRLDRIRALDVRVIEPVDDLEARGLGEGLDRQALPRLTVSLDVRRA